MIRIILSADDFGRSLERNEAIDKSFQQGLIKSAAIMVSTKYTQDAIDRAMRGGYISQCHCHFNLVGGENGAYQKPLTKDILKDPYICKDGEFLDYGGYKLNGKRGLLRLYSFLPIYRELIAQFNEFKRLTHGKANYSHLDFHLYYNLNFPVAIAFNLFVLRFRIRSVRVIGEHLKQSKRMRVLSLIASNPFVKTYKACNIDYFLTKRCEYSKSEIIELYVHPDIDGQDILDNSYSIFGHPKKKLIVNIESLKVTGDCKFLSWSQI